MNVLKHHITFLYSTILAFAAVIYPNLSRFFATIIPCEIGYDKMTHLSQRQLKKIVILTEFNIKAPSISCSNNNGYSNPTISNLN